MTNREKKFLLIEMAEIRKFSGKVFFVIIMHRQTECLGIAVSSAKALRGLICRQLLLDAAVRRGSSAT